MTNKELQTLAELISVSLLKQAQTNNGVARSARLARRNITQNDSDNRQTELGEPKIVPLGAHLPPTIDDMIQRHVFNYMSQTSGQQDYDFDDNDDWDFDDEDEFDGSKHLERQIYDSVKEVDNASEPTQQIIEDNKKEAVKAESEIKES